MLRLFEWRIEAALSMFDLLCVLFWVGNVLFFSKHNTPHEAMFILIEAVHDFTVRRASKDSGVESRATFFVPDVLLESYWWERTSRLKAISHKWPPHPPTIKALLSFMYTKSFWASNTTAIFDFFHCDRYYFLSGLMRSDRFNIWRRPDWTRDSAVTDIRRTLELKHVNYRVRLAWMNEWMNEWRFLFLHSFL